jgi:hypothetical protein
LILEEKISANDNLFQTLQHWRRHTGNTFCLFRLGWHCLGLLDGIRFRTADSLKHMSHPMRTPAEKMKLLLINSQNTNMCAALAFAVHEGQSPHREVPPVWRVAMNALSDIERVLRIAAGPSELMDWLKTHRHNSVRPLSKYGQLRHIPLRPVNAS